MPGVSAAVAGDGWRAAGSFRSSAATHDGAVRTHNEDCYVNRPDVGLWAVADGAGGHSKGERASGLVAAALDAIPVGLDGPTLLAEVRRAIGEAHTVLRREAEALGDRAVIATTVAVLLAVGGHFACLWAGDSRVYLLRGGTLTQVTRDHSLVQELVDAGAITAAEAEGHPRANVITRAVGVDADRVELDKVTDRLVPGDRFLLCSDGLCKTLDDGAIGALLLGRETAAVADHLIAAALAKKATDNVTAVVVDYVEVREDDTILPVSMVAGR